MGDCTRCLDLKPPQAPLYIARVVNFLVTEHGLFFGEDVPHPDDRSRQATERRIDLLEGLFAQARAGWFRGTVAERLREADLDAADLPDGPPARAAALRVATAAEVDFDLAPLSEAAREGLKRNEGVVEAFTAAALDPEKGGTS